MDAHNTVSRPVRQTELLGAAVDSLRTAHARVAALTRHRGPDDPDVERAREELESCKEQTRRVRERIGGLSPAMCEDLLNGVSTVAQGG